MQSANPQDLHAGLQRAYLEAFPTSDIDIDNLMGSWENQAGMR